MNANTTVSGSNINSTFKTSAIKAFKWVLLRAALTLGFAFLIKAAMPMRMSFNMTLIGGLALCVVAHLIMKWVGEAKRALSSKVK
ncbi:MAG: hypothetical protein ABIO72_01075 [Patescibacteria group bacterium]